MIASRFAWLVPLLLTFPAVWNAPAQPAPGAAKNDYADGNTWLCRPR